MAAEAESRLDGRIEQLKNKLAARTDASGKPFPGFATNVRAIEAEITRLETLKAEQALA